MATSLACQESSNPSFSTVEVVRDPDGVIAIITERAKDGRISFSLCREYEEQGVTRRTAYLKQQHIAALRRLLNDLDERLEVIENRSRAKHR